MSKICKVGDRVRVIEKPNRHEYPFDIGEVLTIKRVTKNYIGVEHRYYYWFSDGRVILASRAVPAILKNVIGGKIL